MTLIIGVRCTDGIIVAADSAATMGSMFGGHTAELSIARKLTILHDSMIVGVSGYTGFAFRLVETLRENHNRYKNQAPHRAMEKLRETVMPLVESELKMAKHLRDTMGNANAFQAVGYEMVIALPLNDAPHLITLDTSCSPDIITPDITCVSVGSASRLADPFLGFVRSVLWPERDCPKLREGTLGAVWAMKHAIRINTGGVGGRVQIAVLRDDGKKNFKAAELPEVEVAEHEEAIEDLENHIRAWPGKLHQPPDAPAAPKLPE